MPLACFDANRKLSTHHPTCRRHVPTLWRYRFEKFDTTSYQEIIWSLGFSAVKRRAVFILGAMWWALVRGWRRDCVVGGMETRFQWRKAHSRTAKCEAFHVAPRLFFYVFVFDSIHNSITLHNLSPQIFHRSKKAQPITLIIQIQLFG